MSRHLLSTALLVCTFAAMLVVAVDDAMENAREAQAKVDQVTSDMVEKIHQMEVEFQKSKEPLYESRGDVLRQIKGFWARTLINHPSSTNWIHENDKQILDHLTDIRVEESGDGRRNLHSYKILMYFDTNNPYFEETVLWRAIDGLAEDETSKASGITWRTGAVPTEQSFFNFFENTHRSKWLPSHFYNDIAHVIKFEFWPNPFTYFDLPEYERFNPASPNYEAELDAANEGGLPPDADSVNNPDHDDSPKEPTDEEIAAAQAELAAIERKSEEAEKARVESSKSQQIPEEEVAQDEKKTESSDDKAPAEPPKVPSASESKDGEEATAKETAGSSGPSEKKDEEVLDDPIKEEY